MTIAVFKDVYLTLYDQIIGLTEQIIILLIEDSIKKSNIIISLIGINKI